MNKQALLDLIRDWGYYPLPKSHPDSPGYSGLLVAIRAAPTGQHYDPEKLCLHLHDIKGFSRSKTSTWPWPLPSNDHVCPGPVTLHDRHDKRVHFFVFGGSLEVIQEPDILLHVIRSPAPILELTEETETIADNLVFETEALIGELEEKLEELQAQGIDQPHTYVDPFRLYIAALQSIFQRYEQTADLQTLHHDFYEALVQERAWLTAQGLWLTQPATFEELLPSCLIGAI